VRSDLKVTQEIVSKVRKYMERTKKTDLKTSRLLSLILCKDMDISDTGIDELLQLLNYGDSSHDRRKRNKNGHDTENEDDTKKWVKKVIQKTSENPDNLLHVFNHLNGKSQNWIVIPYCYHEKSEIYEGTIRVLYNPISKKTEKVVFTVAMDEKDSITFYIQQKEEIIHIKMFTSGLEDHVHFEKKLQELRIKLQNKGAKIDDIVYNEADFDGFTPRTDVFPYKTIDTLT
jgi:hypothetical protein